MPTDLEIAHSVTPRPIGDVAADLGLTPDDLEPYGRDKAKISQPALEGCSRSQMGHAAS